MLRQLFHARRMIAEEFADAGASQRRLDLERRLLRAEAGILGVRELGRRAIEDIVQNRPLNNIVSVIKLTSSQLMQTLDEIGLGAKGPRLAARFHIPGV